MTSQHECRILMDMQQAKNDFEWLKFLVDIEYLSENKIELIGEPD